MNKHLDEEIAKRFYHGGRVFFYSDPHFGDLGSYKKRFPNLFKLPFKLILDLADVYRKNNINILEAFDSIAISVPDKKVQYTEDELEQIVKLLDDAQIKNINSKCSKNDTIIIIGDI